MLTLWKEGLHTDLRQIIQDMCVHKWLFFVIYGQNYIYKNPSTFSWCVLGHKIFSPGQQSIRLLSMWFVPEGSQRKMSNSALLQKWVEYVIWQQISPRMNERVFQIKLEERKFPSLTWWHPQSGKADLTCSVHGSMLIFNMEQQSQVWK